MAWVLSDHLFFSWHSKWSPSVFSSFAKPYWCEPSDSSSPQFWSRSFTPINCMACSSLPCKWWPDPMFWPALTGVYFHINTDVFCLRNSCFCCMAFCLGTLLFCRHAVSMPGMAFSVMDAPGKKRKLKNTKIVTIKRVPASMSSEVAWIPLHGSKGFP